MDTRENALKDWLIKQCKLTQFQLEPMAGDASFRRYFRVYVMDGSYVAMDASQDRKNCLPFIAISKALHSLGLTTPQILQSDLSQGFLLLTDLGDKQLLTELSDDNAESLYSLALNALSKLKDCQKVEGWEIPVFTEEFMRKELQLFQEWFLQKHLKLVLHADTEHQLSTCFDFLAHSAAQQPKVFMHRDYHSANLMVLPHAGIGILDFQDAFIGPVTYDLVSLLRDCYIAWPDSLVNQLVLQYWETLNLSGVTFEEFSRWFDLMGLQRHMKALLTFSRKFHRDGNAGYLQHIPRTLNYILKISERYPECQKLHEFVLNQVITCAQ